MDTQSKDGTDTDTDSTDERFPLISLFVDDAAVKAPSRMDRVVHGATLLMSHWPQHASSSMFLFNVVLCLVLLGTCALATLAYMCSMLRSDGGHVSTLQALGILGMTPCDYVTPTVATQSKLETRLLGDVLPRSAPQAHDISFHRHEPSQLDKLFYAHMQGEHLTTAQACAIESAVKANPTVTCYILLFTQPSAESTQFSMTEDVKMQALAQKYSNIQLLIVDGGSYFHASPLHVLWQQFNSTSALLRFAARVLTLWQYGGTSYDLSLLTVRNNSVSSLPNTEDVVVVELNEGLVMSSRQQCHAFLFEVMRVLASITQSVGQELKSVGDVLSQALFQFCHGGHITVSNSSVMVNLTCKGVVPVKSDCVCKKIVRESTCVWVEVHNDSWPPSICPVATQGMGS